MRSFIQQTRTEQSLGAVGGAGDGMVNEATGVPGVAERALSRGRECFQGSRDPAGGVSSGTWPRAECKPPDPICFSFWTSHVTGGEGGEDAVGGRGGKSWNPP